VANAVRQAFSPSHIAPLLLSLAGGPPGTPPARGTIFYGNVAQAVSLHSPCGAGCQACAYRPVGLRYAPYREPRTLPQRL
jgi:hypothetical protein